MTDLENISLTSLYKRQKTDRDIFQELMPWKVKEILLIATVYDSYSIEREGQFSDKIFGEYLQLNLYASPRFTSANSGEDALKLMHSKHFDMVIIMAGVDKEIPLKIAEDIRFSKSDIPILLLVNNNSDLTYFEKVIPASPSIDRVFVWNGNSNVFVAMIKYIEDKTNVAKDIKMGNVRIVLLVEDSARYYSRYLPLLYTSIMTQTQNLVADNSTDELHKILKVRARPKVLLVSTYEDAMDIISHYGEALLCVISDVQFARNGKDDEDAGIELLKEAMKTLRYPIPTLLQSHDKKNALRAKEIGSEFIDKNSNSLSLDINKYINQRLGFGDFIFRNGQGEKINVARNLTEFEDLLTKVPAESLVYHAKMNAFSSWLIARGEINMAERLLPIKIEDFNDPNEVRAICIKVFHEVREKRFRGHIVNFLPELTNGNRYILRLGRGSLGGKGRGLAFISNLIENIDFKKLIPGINIRIPATSIIGAIEFDKFLELNNLDERVYTVSDYEKIKKEFLKAELSVTLRERLYQYVKEMKQPLAIRSSGLFEDSLLQPFSGVYATYMIPNNDPDINVRLEQLETAVKLIYASIFTDSARSYFEAVNYKIEEEKMAVVIQEVVGHEYNKKYYPNISGVAQSYNFYPFSYMEPEDGFAVCAVGLGMHVVGGNKAYRFCPKYPRLNNASVSDQMRDSQRKFNALDMTKSVLDLETDGEEAAILQLRIAEAEKDENLDHCASTYDMENDYVEPGVMRKGPRLIDFANVLKYDYAPVAQSIQLLLNLFKQAMGAPVEMEFAVDLEKGEYGLPTFYLLQIKPLIRKDKFFTIDPKKLVPERQLMLAKKGMGNGKIQTITDVVYVDIDSFDKTQTKEIAKEIREINKKFTEEDKNYILIGPGRWGTRDPFTGIPVLWSDISKAKIIVEVGLPNFPLDASLGSHFFHNVTSMDIGYFSIPFNTEESSLNYDLLNKGEEIERTTYVKRIRFQQNLNILMDGKERIGVIEV